MTSQKSSSHDKFVWEKLFCAWKEDSFERFVLGRPFILWLEFSESCMLRLFISSCWRFQAKYEYIKTFNLWICAIFLFLGDLENKKHDNILLIINFYIFKIYFIMHAHDKGTTDNLCMIFLFVNNFNLHCWANLYIVAFKILFSQTGFPPLIVIKEDINGEVNGIQWYRLVMMEFSTFIIWTINI